MNSNTEQEQLIEQLNKDTDLKWIPFEECGARTVYNECGWTVYLMNGPCKYSLAYYAAGQHDNEFTGSSSGHYTYEETLENFMVDFLDTKKFFGN